MKTWVPFICIKGPFVFLAHEIAVGPDSGLDNEPVTSHLITQGLMLACIFQMSMAFSDKCLAFCKPLMDKPTLRQHPFSSNCF